MSIEIPVLAENVIMKLSGGADSALLLWLLCNEWTKQDKPLHVYTITVIHKQRPWQPYHAQQVLDFMHEQWPDVHFVRHDTRLAENPKDQYSETQELMKMEIINEIKEDIQVFNAITSNPPLKYKDYWSDLWETGDLKMRAWETREERKVINQHHHDGFMAWYCSPFFQHDKRTVMELYQKHGLLRHLLPLTRSCEGWDYMTKNFTEECHSCWWCKEREWALSVLS
jgi:hypothetical protein